MNYYLYKIGIGPFSKYIISNDLACIKFNKIETLMTFINCDILEIVYTEPIIEEPIKYTKVKRKYRAAK